MKLYTVGYEGTSIEEFVSFMKEKKIRMIVDVRKNPISRKKGFSKNKLAEALGARGIQYLHAPALGVPTEWRKKAKAEEITRAKMFRDHARNILPEARESVNLLRRLLRERRTAVLCYENDASDCHRRNVTDEVRRLEKNKVQVEDLNIRDRFDTGGLPSLRSPGPR